MSVQPLDAYVIVSLLYIRTGEGDCYIPLEGILHAHGANIQRLYTPSGYLHHTTYHTLEKLQSWKIYYNIRDDKMQRDSTAIDPVRLLMFRSHRLGMHDGIHYRWHLTLYLRADLMRNRVRLLNGKRRVQPHRHI